MRCWLVLCVVLGACGFQSPAAGGGTSDAGVTDGPAIDGTGDAPGDGPGSSGTTDCFQHWMDGSVRIDPSAIQDVTAVSGTGDNRNPWISDDGRRMYFSRDLGTQTQGDIYFTSRATTSQSFGAPTLEPNLSTNGQEGRVWLTPDELTVVQSTDSGGPLDIHMITRAAGDPFGTPDGRHLGAVNLAGAQRFDPFVTANGLRLYLAASSGAGGRLQLLIATRAITTDDFAAPAQVPGTSGFGGTDLANLADPTLYEDERLLLFSAFPQGMGAHGDLWFATRSSATASFGPPTRIPTVNTGGADEFDPVLSADGCELYFASNRTGGKFHIFHAQVTK